MTDAATLVTAWISLCGFSAAGYGSNHQDISRQYSGILYGLSNGLASVAASGGWMGGWLVGGPLVLLGRSLGRVVLSSVKQLPAWARLGGLCQCDTNTTSASQPCPSPSPPLLPSPALPAPGPSLAPPACSVHLRHGPGAALHP